jgi:plasmid stabilization system protein ParE
MKHRVNISRRAERDLFGAYTYIATDSPERADHWLAAMDRAILGLGEFPSRCPPALESAEFLPDLRQLSVLGYRIIFQTLKDGVLVVHIRHASRAPARLEEIQQDE